MARLCASVLPEALVRRVGHQEACCCGCWGTFPAKPGAEKTWKPWRPPCGPELQDSRQWQAAVFPEAGHVWTDGTPCFRFSFLSFSMPAAPRPPQPSAGGGEGTKCGHGRGKESSPGPARRGRCSRCAGRPSSCDLGSPSAVPAPPQHGGIWSP